MNDETTAPTAPARPTRRTVLVTFPPAASGRTYVYEVEGLFSDRVLVQFAWRNHCANGGEDVDFVNAVVTEIDPGAAPAAA